MFDEAQSKNIATELLAAMGVAAEIEVSNFNDQPYLNIESPDHAILIGRGGENLRSLQYIINLILKHNIKDSPFVVVDVAGYKKERSQKIAHIAKEAADKAVSTSRDVRLKPMNSYERRLVHMHLAENPEVETSSEGEEPHRTIIIKKRP